LFNDLPLWLVISQGNGEAQINIVNVDDQAEVDQRLQQSFDFPHISPKVRGKRSGAAGLVAFKVAEPLISFDSDMLLSGYRTKIPAMQHAVFVVPEKIGSLVNCFPRMDLLDEYTRVFAGILPVPIIKIEVIGDVGCMFFGQMIHIGEGSIRPYIRKAK